MAPDILEAHWGTRTPTPQQGSLFSFVFSVVFGVVVVVFQVLVTCFSPIRFFSRSFIWLKRSQPISGLLLHKLTKKDFLNILIYVSYHVSPGEVHVIYIKHIYMLR